MIEKYTILTTKNIMPNLLQLCLYFKTHQPPLVAITVCIICLSEIYWRLIAEKLYHKWFNFSHSTHHPEQQSAFRYPATQNSLLKLYFQFCFLAKCKLSVHHQK